MHRSVLTSGRYAGSGTEAESRLLFRCEDQFLTIGGLDMLLDRIHDGFIEFGFTSTEINEPNTVRRSVDFDVHGISWRRKV
jgi:hypothetical protein